jgi:hypothetical protein
MDGAVRAPCFAEQSEVQGEFANQTLICADHRSALFL